ncbi:MAG TPA: extracellular solute-binding protein [Trueperaceae bacterium]|nr:extracellular solute-binding protein [Trueperaceae bacterium]
MKRCFSFVSALGLAVAMAAGLAGVASAASTVTVEIPQYSDATKPFFEGAAKAFMQDHPDVKVNIQESTWDNLHQVLVTDIAAKKAPDISIIGTRWLPEYISSDVALPLDLPSSFTDRFIPAFLQPSSISGQLYGLPWAASDRALIYNKALFQQAGIQNPPTTWDELQADAAKIAKLPGRYGFGLQGSQIETDVYYYYFLWGAGGEIVGQDGNSGLHSQAASDALSYLKGLIDAKVVEPNVTSNTREDLRTLFGQGRLGMFIYLPPIIGWLKDNAPSVDYGIAPLPHKTTAVTYAVTDTIMMFKPSVTGASDQQVKDAQAFLQFVFSKDNRVNYNKQEGFLPVLQDVSQDPYFTGNEKLNAFVQLLPDAKFAPIIPNWEKIAQRTTTMLQNVYLGQEQPQPALSGAASDIDQILKQ